MGGTGPIGALRPWWLTPLWFLAGVGWWLVLLVPGWLAFPRAVEQRRVAAAAPLPPSTWPSRSYSASGRPRAAGIGSWPC